MSWDEDLRQHLRVELEPDAQPEAQSSVLALIGQEKQSGKEQILLMKRTMTVETHKGQLCFPGGYREKHDKDLLATALRETEEEIGVAPGDITVLGRLKPVYTRNEVLITPWVGRLDFPYPFKLNDAEVERLIFLPVDRLVGEGLKPVTANVGVVRVSSIGMTIDGDLLWGATARMLEELRQYLLKFWVTA